MGLNTSDKGIVLYSVVWTGKLYVMTPVGMVVDDCGLVPVDGMVCAHCMLCCRLSEAFFCG